MFKNEKKNGYALKNIGFRVREFMHKEKNIFESATGK